MTIVYYGMEDPGVKFKITLLRERLIHTSLATYILINPTFSNGSLQPLSNGSNCQNRNARGVARLGYTCDTSSCNAFPRCNTDTSYCTLVRRMPGSIVGPLISRTGPWSAIQPRLGLSEIPMHDSVLRKALPVLTSAVLYVPSLRASASCDGAMTLLL